MVRLVSLFILVVLVALAESGKLTFPTSDYNVNNVAWVSGMSFIAKHQIENQVLIFTDAEIFDLTNHLQGPLFRVAPAPVRAYSFDGKGNIWSVNDSGFSRYNEKDSSLKTYKYPNLASYYATTVECDPTNLRVIIGCGADGARQGGMTIVSLDANDNPTAFTTIVGNQSIHKVGSYKQFVWAANSQAMYRYDGTTVKKYDSSNSPIENVAGAFVNVDGNVYVGCDNYYDSTAHFTTYVAKYDAASDQWSRIVLPAAFNDCPIVYLVVDYNNQLWLSAKLFARMDLATGNIDSVRVNGTVSWLNLNGGTYAALGLTDDRRVLIGGYNAFVENTSGNAVRWNASTLRPIQSKAQFVGLFNLKGQRIVNNFSSFSSVHSLSAGNYFVITRTSNGIKAEKTAIAR